LQADGRTIATQWWGDRPHYDPQPTLHYYKQAVPELCQAYGGDPTRVVLAGFSRGAIACNYLGLYDDEIARLWAAFVPYSHYDGVYEKWGYPQADRKSALSRLQRLGQRPQWISQEQGPTATQGLTATQRYLESTGVRGHFTFQETGFRNHNDAWVLRPSAARQALRRWLQQVVKPSQRPERR
jgi:predicted esterase